MIDELLLQDFMAKQQAAVRGGNKQLADLARVYRIAQALADTCRYGISELLGEGM